MAEAIVDYTPEEMIETLAELVVEKLRSQPVKRYYKQHEIMNHFKIGHRKLMSWVAMGLPYIEIEHSIFYDIKDVEAFMDKHKV